MLYVPVPTLGLCGGNNIAWSFCPMANSAYLHISITECRLLPAYTFPLFTLYRSSTIIPILGVVGSVAVTSGITTVSGFVVNKFTIALLATRGGGSIEKSLRRDITFRTFWNRFYIPMLGAMKVLYLYLPTLSREGVLHTPELVYRGDTIDSEFYCFTSTGGTFTSAHFKCRGVSHIVLL